MVDEPRLSINDATHETIRDAGMCQIQPTGYRFPTPIVGKSGDIGLRHINDVTVVDCELRGLDEIQHSVAHRS